MKKQYTDDSDDVTNFESAQHFGRSCEAEKTKKKKKMN